MRSADTDAKALAARHYGEMECALGQSGGGRPAAEVIRRAREGGMFVHDSPELVSMLMQIDLDARIPRELYIAVADVVAWVHRVDRAIPPPPGRSR